MLLRVKLYRPAKEGFEYDKWFWFGDFRVFDYLEDLVTKTASEDKPIFQLGEVAGPGSDVWVSLKQLSIQWFDGRSDPLRALCYLNMLVDIDIPVLFGDDMGGMFRQAIVRLEEEHPEQAALMKNRKQ